MRSLALVDLDNVAFGTLRAPHAPPRSSSSGWLRAGERALPPTPDGEPCVVVLAFNTSTAESLTFARVREFAAALATALGDYRVGALELVATLPAPQTADASIHRLLEFAATDDGEGTFDEVWLLSDDKGLGRDMAAWFMARDGSCSTLEGGSVRRFRRPVPHRRSAEPTKLQRYVGVTAPDQLGCCVDINSFGLVAWVKDQELDLPEDVELASLAHWWQRRPGTLTQCGPTLQSLRGVRRLGALPEVRVVGRCDRKDGLELCRAEVPLGVSAARVKSVSLGPGAVRLVDVGATVMSKVPLQVLAAICNNGRRIRVAANRATVAVAHAMELAAMVGVEVGSYKVRLSTEKNRLLAGVVVESSKRSPAGWWVWQRLGRKWKPKSEMSGTIGHLLRSTIPQVQCAMRVIGGPAGPELVFAAKGGSWRVARPIVEGRIGAVDNDNNQQGALLALGGAVAPGAVELGAIQDVSPGRLRSLLPEVRNIDYLRRLPLLVPVSLCQTAGGAASSG